MSQVVFLVFPCQFYIVQLTESLYNSSKIKIILSSKEITNPGGGATVQRKLELTLNLDSCAPGSSQPFQSAQGVPKRNTLCRDGRGESAMIAEAPRGTI